MASSKPMCHFETKRTPNSFSTINPPQREKPLLLPPPGWTTFSHWAELHVQDLFERLHGNVVCLCRRRERSGIRICQWKDCNRKLWSAFTLSLNFSSEGCDLTFWTKSMGSPPSKAACDTVTHTVQHLFLASLAASRFNVMKAKCHLTCGNSCLVHLCG